MGRGGAIKSKEEKDEQITTAFVKQPLALPGSATHDIVQANISYHNVPCSNNNARYLASHALSINTIQGLRTIRIYFVNILCGPNVIVHSLTRRGSSVVTEARLAILFQTFGRERLSQLI